MSKTAYLVLEDGKVFEGKFFGAENEISGEIVFTTAMTGYLETLTDQSYHGQIVLQTFPLIGNYGVIPADFESSSVGASAYIVKHPCQEPSNFRCEGTLDTFLKQNNITGLYGIDTRAVTKIIREKGVMNGIITADKDSVDFDKLKAYTIKNAVSNVSIKECQEFKAENAKYNVALLDFGIKDNIRKELVKRGCNVTVMPHTTTLADIKKLNPDGIMLSNGPGDPAENTDIIENLKEIIEAGIPVFGICLGHQLLALANGFKTHKLKYGHRGANQPVQEVATGKVYISSQNHGYAVTPETIDQNIGELSFINVNDKTCEGVNYKGKKIFSVQFHPEACGGPLDTSFLFDRFINNMGGNA